MADNKNQTPTRVVMSPWLGYGHISPYLELARKLISRNFIIYLCSTPATLNSIQKQITEKLSHFIKIVPLLLPNLPGLPHDLHTTNGLPPRLMPKLIEAFNMAGDDFSNIMAELKPDLLIYDILQEWAPLVAKEQNIPAVHFITSSSTSMSFMFHYFTDPSVEFPFSKIRHRDYESSEKKLLLENASNLEKKGRVFRDVHGSSEIVLIKGFREIESKYIDYVTSLVGRRFIPVGPLVQMPSPDENVSKNCDILSGLVKKEKNSTVFVSFGSEYFLSKDDIYEIAYGLELSQINFIWVVRLPKDVTNGHINGFSLIEKTLPKGFVERVGNRGKILEGWAPKAKILGHENIGGFVSHCGWSSVMESMFFGVPIIGVPMHLDQPVNARLVEEVGFGIEVLRDKNKRLRRETLAKVIKQVVIEDCGELVRRKADEMKKKLNSEEDEEIDEVVKELDGLCNKSATKF